MAKKDKELVRRVKKMRKHVDALHSLVETEKERNVLEEMGESLAFLEGSHPSQGGNVEPIKG